MKKTTRAIQGLFLFVAAVFITSCTDSNRILKQDELIGEWKIVQLKASPNHPLRDVTDCKGDSVGQKANVYTFKSGGAFLQKDVCSGKLIVGSTDNPGHWVYAADELTLFYHDKGENAQTSFLVEDKGNGKISLRHLYTFYDKPNCYLSPGMYSYVLEKQ